MIKRLHNLMTVLFTLLIFSIIINADEIEKLNSGIEMLAGKIVKQMQVNEIKLIAMGDFDNSNGKTQFERNIEIGLVNSIVGKNLEDISVIERKNLSEVLKEQKLGSTGLLAKNTRAKLGEILGVDAIVTAETTVLKRKVTVNVRMYSIATGRILAAPSYTFLRSETIDELLEHDAQDDSLQVYETNSHTTTKYNRKPYKQKENTCFSNNYIQGCSKISRSKDRKRVTITTTLENNTDTDIFLGQITTCYDTRDSYCSQDKSDKSEYSTINCELVADGMGHNAKKTRGLATFFRRWIDRDKINTSNLTSLNRKSKISISYSFISDKEQIEGEYFDFSANAVMYYTEGKEKNLKKEKITISGTDLYLPNKK
jgi:hypothetical protein